MPNVYTYLRTDPAKVIGKELVDDFVKHLTTFCVEELAGLTPLPPWLTLHLNGTRHEIHNDGKNGSYGYVYSLTRSLEAFTGGETCVSREGVFDSLEPRQLKCGGAILRLFRRYSTSFFSSMTGLRTWFRLFKGR